MKEIYERRSIRDFLSKDIPEDILRKIIEAALKAPSTKQAALELCSADVGR